MSSPLDDLPPPGSNPLDSLPPPVTQTPPAQPYSFGQFVKDYGSAAIRPIVKGVTGLPIMAMDVGVAARNFGSYVADTGKFPPFSAFNPFSQSGYTGGAYELPSQTLNTALDSVTVAPTTTVGKLAEFGNSVLAGSQVPGPTSIGGLKLGPLNWQAAEAPAGFAPQMLRQQILQRAQEEGYVAPPSNTNPTFMNRLLEGISGKLKLQQEMSVRNQGVTDRLSAEALGQNSGASLTQGSLASIRDEASGGFAAIRHAGEMAADDTFRNRIADLSEQVSGATRMGLKQAGPFDSMASKLSELDRFDSGDALDGIRYLRALADDAFQSGSSVVGRQYKGAANALEDLITRNLENRGQQGADWLKQYQEARQLMAQTYTAGKALVGDTGNFNARSYASELARGKPLVDQQRLIGEFSTAFPKVTRLMQESVPSVSPLDAYGSAIAAAEAHSAAPLLVPLSRVGIREYLMSQAGQARAITPPTQVPQNLGGLPSLSLQIQQYLSQ